MGIVDFIFYLIVSGIIGFVAAQLMGARKFNVGVLILVGFIGALLGRAIAHFFSLPHILPIVVGGRSLDLVWAAGGSILLVGLIVGFNQRTV